jgi:SAM-dependent methyltransferase
MEQFMDAKSILFLASGYQLWTRLINRENAYKAYSDKYLRPRAEDRILDIGCGPADVLEFLPPGVHYVGVDHNPRYIETASSNYGSVGTFHCEEVRDFLVSEPRSFDLVIATGIVHHLDDSEARIMFKAAWEALKPGGRLVTCDPCLVKGQSRIARWFINHDRGQYVRDQEGYRKLAGAVFSNIKVAVRHDLLRIPYTNIIMEMTQDEDR